MPLRLSPWNYVSRVSAGMLSAAVIASAAYAAEGSQDYSLQVLDQPVAVSAHSEFNVQLTNTSTGKPVQNAKITQTRLEMTMMHRPHKSGTPNPSTRDMGGEVKVVASPAPGVYRLLADVSMPGRWDLEVLAAVPGEAKPVKLTSTFQAGQ